MYGLPEHLKVPSAAEEQVLLAVWRCGPKATAAAVAKALSHTGWASTTRLTLLTRLEQKGWLQRVKEESGTVYLPRVTQRAYRVYTARERLDTVCEGDLPALLAALLSEHRPGAAQLEAAQAVLQEHLDAQAEYDWYDPYG